MHKFIRSLALLAFIPAIAASIARADDTQISPNSNTPALAQQTDTNLLGPSGISSLTASPFWVSSEGSGSETTLQGDRQLRLEFADHRGRPDSRRRILECG